MYICARVKTPVPLAPEAAKVPPEEHPVPPETITTSVIPCARLMVELNPLPAEADPSVHVLETLRLPGM
jgi:hypothetical protein